jgi:hypothetical protein
LAYLLSVRPGKGVTVVGSNPPRRYAISLFYSYRDAATVRPEVMNLNPA